MTKTHNLAYEEHTYYKTNILKKISDSNSITESQWNNKNFRIQFFKNHFELKNFSRESQCIEYTKGRIGNIYNINENIISEINSAKCITLIKLNVNKNIFY